MCAAVQGRFGNFAQSGDSSSIQFPKGKFLFHWESISSPLPDDTEKRFFRTSGPPPTETTMPPEKTEPPGTTKKPKTIEPPGTAEKPKTAKPPNGVGEKSDFGSNNSCMHSRAVKSDFEFLKV